MEQAVTKRPRITPVQRDVLWTLEESGEESLPCLLNTLKIPPAENSQIGWEFREELSGLIRRGFVEWSSECSSTDPLQLAFFDPNEQLWSAPRECRVYMTNEGRQVLTR